MQIFSSMVHAVWQGLMPDNNLVQPQNKQSCSHHFTNSTFALGFSQDIGLKAGLDFYPGPFFILYRLIITYLCRTIAQNSRRIS